MDRQPAKRHTPPVEKSPRMLSRVLWAMLVLTLLSAVLGLLEGDFGAAMVNYHHSIPVAIVNFMGAMGNAFIILKLLSPGWDPHRKTLGWLLGGTLALNMTGVVLMIVQIFSGGLDPTMQAAVDVMIETQPQGAITVAIVIVSVISVAAGLLFSPEFHLLRGLALKKSTEKIAGACAVLALVVSVFFLLASLADFSLTDFLTSLLSPLISAGYVVVFFGWPVLNRAVGEQA